VKSVSKNVKKKSGPVYEKGNLVEGKGGGGGLIVRVLEKHTKSLGRALSGEERGLEGLTPGEEILLNTHLGRPECASVGGHGRK